MPKPTQRSVQHEAPEVLECIRITDGELYDALADMFESVDSYGKAIEARGVLRLPSLNGKGGRESLLQAVRDSTIKATHAIAEARTVTTESGPASSLAEGEGSPV